MKKAALDAARTSLAEAKSALSGMESADSLAKMETAWSDFLVKANRIYTKLEQGAKGNNKSDPWFGRKQNERKKTRCCATSKTPDMLTSMALNG